MRLRYCTACCDYVPAAADCASPECPQLYDIEEPEENEEDEKVTEVNFNGIEQAREYLPDTLTDDTFGNHVDADGMHVERFDDE